MTDLFAQYKPPTLLTNPHLQNVAASCGLRRLIYQCHVQLRQQKSENVVLDCGEGVRLQGFYDAPSGTDPAKGLVIILHGWLGSASSDYVVSLAWHLLSQGYAIFRLNFRDHGNTHHLNEGHFNSTHLDEVGGAITAIQRRFPAQKTFLAGFSLGGNFALRMALRQDYHQPLTRVFAVSPVICPSSCFACLSSAAFFYEKYFVVKWRHSLLAKSRAFEKYRYYDHPLKQFKHLDEMNEYFIPRLTEYRSVQAYMDAYSLAGDTLASLKVKATALFAMDDPIVPIDDVDALAKPACLDIIKTPFGGHCAFLSAFSLQSFANRLATELFDRDCCVSADSEKSFSSPSGVRSCQNQ